jgi:hypothetical protein
MVARAVASFRLHYPDAPLVLFGDGGDNFSSTCEVQHCTWLPNEHLNNPSTSTYAADAAGALELFRRYFAAFEVLRNGGATHALLLEDDVRVLRPITQRFTAAISGNNLDAQMWFMPNYVAFLTNKSGWDVNLARSIPDAGFGGAVFDLDFMLDKVSVADTVKPLLDFLEGVHEKDFISDRLFTTAIAVSPTGCKPPGGCGFSEPFVELAEAWYPDFTARVASGRTSVVHNFKVEYKDEPTEADLKVLGWPVAAPA